MGLAAKSPVSLSRFSHKSMVLRLMLNSSLASLFFSPSSAVQPHSLPRDRINDLGAEIITVRFSHRGEKFKGLSLFYVLIALAIAIVEDNAGWHRSQKLKVPNGIIVEFLPAYSPELQPAERLWTLVDEPLVNEYFETIEEIEDVLASRCCMLQNMTEEIKNLTNYHWLNYS